jgi:hypothetical protein
LQTTSAIMESYQDKILSERSRNGLSFPKYRYK